MSEYCQCPSCPWWRCITSVSRVPGDVSTNSLTCVTCLRWPSTETQSHVCPWWPSTNSLTGVPGNPSTNSLRWPRWSQTPSTISLTRVPGDRAGLKHRVLSVSRVSQVTGLVSNTEYWFRLRGCSEDERCGALTAPILVVIKAWLDQPSAATQGNSSESPVAMLLWWWCVVVVVYCGGGVFWWCVVVVVCCDNDVFCWWCVLLVMCCGGGGFCDRDVQYISLYTLLCLTRGYLLSILQFRHVRDINYSIIN